MREVIGLLIFWFTTFGYIILLNKKCKLPSLLGLPMVFTLYGILMFTGGIINTMREFIVFICLGGIGLFVYYLIKDKLIKEALLYIKNRKISFTFIIVVLIYLFVTIVWQNMHLVAYDNFSHWGLIVKNMFVSNGLPNFKNNAISFYNYQPGSACFIYFFGCLAGKTEGMMIVGQSYLTIAYFLSLLYLVKDKTKGKFICSVLVLSFILLNMFLNVYYYNLLVDTLLAAISVYAMVLFYYYKDDLLRAFIYTLPASIFLFLVKNTGVVLVGINCLILLILGFKNKQIKKSFIYAVITGLVTLGFFYVWTRHVAYVYSGNALGSKHSLSPQNILSSVKDKGLENIKEFCIIYYDHFKDISHNMPNKFMIYFDVIFIIMMILFKDKRKDIFKYFVFSNVVYFGYYLILGIMYLVSMPWGEAKNLACFNRYMFTIVCVVMCIMLISILDTVKLSKKDKLKCYVFVITLIGLTNYFTFTRIITDVKILWDNSSYYNSPVYYFDRALGTELYNSPSEEVSYIYYPSDDDDSGYAYYISLYKFNNTNFIIFKNIDSLDRGINKNTNKTIKLVLIDKDDEILNYISNNNFEKINDYYYVYKRQN